MFFLAHLGQKYTSWISSTMYFIDDLTVIDPVADVAPPASLIHEMNEWVDVGTALSTANNCVALYHRQVAEVLEGMDQDAQRQTRLLQDRLRFGDLREKRDATRHNSVLVA